jgi:ribosomal protein S18 acetylase RimI-like enzyme
VKLITIDQSRQVAELLNRRNELPTEYTAERVFKNKDNFFVILKGEKLVAFGETKRVQWYQWEIRHVSVLEGYERRHYGTTVVTNLENIIRQGGGIIAQCTIRNGNFESDGLFTNCGFTRTIGFRNSATGNLVYVYQKNLTELR